jgi:hypothetical protein
LIEGVQGRIVAAVMSTQVSHSATPFSPPSAPPRFRGAPAQLSSFVGREREIDLVRRLLASARLLTLTGAGGSGKTRLAVEIVAREAMDGADGLWVELAPVRDETLLADAVLQAFDVREPAEGQSAIERLTDVIGDRRLLLVLDNCEHLVDACATLADALLRACPGLRILATSREALGVTAETAWLVPPLTVPALDGPADPSEACQLFVERAQAVHPGFERESAAKHRESREQQPFVRLEEFVAPVDRGTKRLMTRKRTAISGLEQLESIVETVGDLIRREHAEARRRELECER